MPVKAKPTAKKKKPAVKTVKKPPNTPPPQGIVVDFSNLGIDDLALTAKEARYVYWYTNPESDTFQNRPKSAVKAGYPPDNARIIAFQLHGKKPVAEAIRRLMEPLKIDVKEEFEHIVRSRIARIHFNVADYYKKVTIKEKNIATGELEDREIEVLKDLSELTPEQLLAVDGVDYKGMTGRKVYQFADREKSMSEMMTVYNKLYGGPANDNNDDGEATMEIIRERLTVKISAREGKNKVGRIAGLIGDGGNSLVQEL
ncbi:terminase small subunit [Treponema sp. R6D11]